MVTTTNEALDNYEELVEKIEQLKKGVWIVYGWDTQVYPVAVFPADQELEARRFNDDQGGYNHVKFWEFGTEWTNK